MQCLSDQIETSTPDSYLPTVVLCSNQYLAKATASYDYFLKNDYDIFVQRLNPGYTDKHPVSIDEDEIQLYQYLLTTGATAQIRDGKAPLENRVNELRQFIYGWAKFRNLVAPDWALTSRYQVPGPTTA